MIEIFFKLKSEYNFYFICNICNNFELHSKKLPILGKHGKIDPVGTDEIDPVKTA